MTIPAGRSTEATFTLSKATAVPEGPRSSGRRSNALPPPDRALQGGDVRVCTEPKMLSLCGQFLVLALRRRSSRTWSRTTVVLGH